MGKKGQEIEKSAFMKGKSSFGMWIKQSKDFVRLLAFTAVAFDAFESLNTSCVVFEFQTLLVFF